MRGGWLVVAAALLVGCQGDGAELEPISGDEQPARDAPERPPQASIEGNYALTTVNGAALPAAVQQQQQTCSTEVVEAALRMEAGRFAFQSRVREVCAGAGASTEPVMHAAGGTYRVDGTTITFSSDVGTAFREARGTADQNTIIVQTMETESGSETVAWRFDLQRDELSPIPGSQDRTR